MPAGIIGQSGANRAWGMPQTRSVTPTGEFSASASEENSSSSYTVIERVVETRTLGRLLEQVALDRFDLLKVDVEGWEERVLRGNDWSRFRPSVILVEATLPERPIKRQSGIAAFLASHGYHQAHFDGLNDFYVREDFRGADGAFALPPNVFDRFESYRLHEIPAHVQRLEAHLKEAKLYSDAEHVARLQKERDLVDAQELSVKEQQANAIAREELTRAVHESGDRQNENKRLRASIVSTEKYCRAYADQVTYQHRDREELLILRDQVDGLQSEIVALEHRLANTQAVADRHRLLELEARGWVTAIRQSTSWKLTLPLRVSGWMIGKSWAALRGS